MSDSKDNLRNVRNSKRENLIARLNKLKQIMTSSSDKNGVQEEEKTEIQKNPPNPSTNNFKSPSDDPSNAQKDDSPIIIPENPKDSSNKMAVASNQCRGKSKIREAEETSDGKIPENRENSAEKKERKTSERLKINLNQSENENSAVEKDKLESPKQETSVVEKRPPNAKVVVDYKRQLKANSKVLIYDPKEGEIQNFRGLDPLCVKLKEDGIRTIIVDLPGLIRTYPPWSENQLYELQSEFKNMETKSIENMEKLARKFGVMSGKWIILKLSWPRAKEIWDVLIKAMFDKTIPLGSGILSVKIPTFDDSESNPHDVNKTKLSVMTCNYLHAKEIWQIEKILRSLGITEAMKYKPTLHSKLDIFANNPYNLKPTIHYSKEQSEKNN